jgi:Arc/MetJ-type ribon-helix-helix transcriptional regulator
VLDSEQVTIAGGIFHPGIGRRWEGGTAETRVFAQPILFLTQHARSLISPLASVNPVAVGAVSWYDSLSYLLVLGGSVSTAKIAITIENDLVARVDRLVAKELFPNRSKAIQEALREKLDRIDRTRLARECAKLDAALEQKLADEGLEQDIEEWPEY